MSTQTRQPAGTPTGGQFAASAHDEADFGLYEPEDAERAARDSVTEAVLEQCPTAVRWEIGTTDEYDDGWYFDESDVQVTYLDGDGQAKRARLDLSRTVAADALREVADESALGWTSTMSADLTARE